MDKQEIPKEYLTNEEMALRLENYLSMRDDLVDAAIDHLRWMVPSIITQLRRK